MSWIAIAAEQTRWIDKQAFAAKAKDAVLANVSDEIRPIVEELFAQ